MKIKPNQTKNWYIRQRYKNIVDYSTGIIYDTDLFISKNGIKKWTNNSFERLMGIAIIT